MLRQLFSAWSKIVIAANITVFDVVTDGFKLVSGAPDLCHDHAGLMARTALSLLTAAQTVMTIMKTSHPLSVRIGIATGPVRMDVGASLCSQPLVVGRAVGMARALVKATEPNTVLISEKVETVLQILRKWTILQNSRTVLMVMKCIF